jgi:hypothetical protein
MVYADKGEAKALPRIRFIKMLLKQGAHGCARLILFDDRVIARQMDWSCDSSQHRIFSFLLAIGYMAVGIPQRKIGKKLQTFLQGNHERKYGVTAVLKFVERTR